MVEYEHSPLDRTLAALADPTRRAILERLREGDARVTEIAAPFDMSLNAISKHLRVLEGAGLIRREVQGREHRIRFDGIPLLEAEAWIERQRRFWEGRLEGLDRFFREKQTRSEKGKP